MSWTEWADRFRQLRDIEAILNPEVKKKLLEGFER